jgi:hypothetical protein
MSNRATTYLRDEPLFAHAAARQSHNEDVDGRDVIRTLKQFAALNERWVHGKVICESLGWPDHENSRRRLRAVAEAHSKEILSGDAGYALLRNCTPEEINHAANRLKAQAEKMLQRSVDIRTAYHQYGKEQPT